MIIATVTALFALIGACCSAVAAQPAPSASYRAPDTRWTPALAQAEDAYYRGDYPRAEQVARQIWIGASTPRGLEATRAAILAARAAYQRGTPFDAADMTTATARFGAAYRAGLDEETRAQALPLLQQLADAHPDTVLYRCAALALASRLGAIPAATLQADLDGLLAASPAVSEAWESALWVALDRKDYAMARAAGERMLAQEAADGRAPARVQSERVRVAAALIGMERPAQAERELATLLQDASAASVPARSQALVHLGNIALSEAARLGPNRRAQRMQAAETARRLFTAAEAEIAGHPGTSAEGLREFIAKALAADYDFSDEVPSYRAARPAKDGTDAAAWLDYATAAQLAGDADETREAALHAYRLALDGGLANRAIAALRILSPTLLDGLDRATVARLFDDWQGRFGDLHRPVADPEGELLRRWVAALRLRWQGERAAAARMLADFLLDGDTAVAAIGTDQHRDSLFELGTFAYQAGLYETAAIAWQACLDLVEEPSMREPILRMLALENLRAFLKDAPMPASAKTDLTDALAALRELAKAAEIEPLRLWRQATEVNRRLQEATPATLKEIDPEDYALIEQVYRTLSARLAGGRELPPYRAGMAKVAARVALTGADPDWGVFWRGIVLEIQQRAADGGLDDRILRYDVEREIARQIGDWRHVARSAAGLALAYLDAGNLDLTGFLLEIWEAQQQADQVLEPVFLTALIDESLRQTRRQMARVQSREAFFRERWQTYDRLLGSLEQVLGRTDLEPVVTEFVAGIYWDLAENLKARFLFDAQVASGGEGQERLDRLNRDLYRDLSRSLLGLFAAEDRGLPTIGTLIETANARIATVAEQRQGLLDDLPPRHPARIEGLGLDALRAALPADTAVLIIVARPRLQDDTGGLMLITAERIQLAPLPVFRWEHDLLRPIFAAWRGPTGDAEQGKLAFLYDALIRPFQPTLDQVRHLIVSPSGPFNNLPVAALWDRERRRWLIETHHVELVPSAKLLAAALASPAQTVPEPGAQPLLYAVNPGRSPPGWGRDDWRQHHQVSLGLASALADLRDLGPFVQAEEEALRGAWPGPIERLASPSPDAPGTVANTLSRERLLAAMQRTGIAHLSMHGLVDATGDGERAVLLLDAADERAGLLRPADLDGADLSGLELVVLSACLVGRGYAFQPEGGNGSTEAGERWLARLGELSGFPRALLQQGVGGLIAPVAEVPAESAAPLWSAFYRALADGDPPAQALARAQRTLLGSAAHRHPRHWGLYVPFRG